MAKEKIIYAAGELDNVKKRLGHVDDKDAKHMQRVLGGEIGRERSDYEEEKIRKKAEESRAAAAETKKAKHTVELLPEENEVSARPARKHAVSSANKIPYSERVKMDECCGEVEYGIKTAWQVVVSKFSFFKAPKDKVAAYFVKVLLNEYYKQVETLVASVRLLFPRNNSPRSLALKKTSLFAFTVLDTLRQWKLKEILAEIEKLQRRPRDVYISDFQTILREIYRPIIILEKLLTVPHIELVFDKLYSVVYLNSPKEAEGMRPKITKAISALDAVRRRIVTGLYPLLMKTLGGRYLHYEEFFLENRAAILDFLGIGEDRIIKAPKAEARENDTGGKNAVEDMAEDTVAEEEPVETAVGNDAEKTLNAEKEEAEQRSIDKGYELLAKLFPSSPIGGNEGGADLFPYFAGILDFRKGTEIISPLDPAQLALTLARIISELLFGFRSIKFNFNKDEEDDISPVLEQWPKTIDETFYNHYIPQLNEYARAFENTKGNIKSQYFTNLLNDIQWMRRYYLFPFYDYKSGFPPSFSKKDINSLYLLSRQLRKILTDIAADIDAAVKNGAPQTGRLCEKIGNPWEPYNFQIENPISKRLGALLSKRQQTNVSLIFFTLAICSVLDNHLNSQSSPAVSFDKDIIVRTLNDAGEEPVFWMEKRSDTEELFNRSIAQRKGKF